MTGGLQAGAGLVKAVAGSREPGETPPPTPSQVGATGWPKTGG